MIDMRYKPFHLPQMSAPFNIVLQKLSDNGVDYEMVDVNPNDLNVSQGITFSDDVEEVQLDDRNPIWISDDNTVIDGHHRMVKALIDSLKLKGIKIKLNHRDACRILNKIQDIFEYEQSRGMEEIVGQDVINSDNNINSSVSDNEFLASLDEDNNDLQSETPSKNERTIIAYRKEPIKEDSIIGNFFLLTPMDGYNKYEIQFDNLLNTDDLGINYKNSQIPVDVLAKNWFPHINFEKLSERYNTPSINLKNKAVAKKAMKMGYDGIKYGDTLLQGLK